MQKDELEKLLSKTHKDISIQDFDGKQIPCIEFTQERFDNIISYISGKPLSVDTNLNILQDGLGHVFVEILLTFSIGGLSEKVLVDASKNLDFFYVLSQNGILSIASKNTPIIFSVFGALPDTINRCFMLEYPSKAGEEIFLIKEIDLRP